MKRCGIAMLLGSIAALALFATPFEVSWVEGKVEKLQGSSWTALNMGDRLDSSSSVRLSPASFAQFTDGRRNIALSAAGTFVLDDFLKTNGDSVKKRAGILDKLVAVIALPLSSVNSSVGGVRGSDEGGSAGAYALEWSMEEPDVFQLLENAKDLVRSGDYAGAEALYVSVAEKTEGKEKEEADYGKAWTLAAQGKSIAAIKVLRAMDPAGTFSMSRALLLARLDIDSGAGAEAVALLSAALDRNGFSAEDAEMARAMLAEAKGK